MDDKLKAYIQNEAEYPPRINENRIIELTEKRRKRFSLIMFSVAAALWTLLFYAATLWVGREIDAECAAYMMLCLSLSYICAGCFAGIVVKLRKVGY
ncbi:MAG: hypothetical protein LBL82_02640 [Oscillospiraceae bacterium]|jgi:hypothetical protein|nr:hypothetical protein [Oscillospiraceae bacterium]